MTEDVEDPPPSDALEPATRGALRELEQRFYELVDLTLARPEVQQLTGSAEATAALRQQLERVLWDERELLAERSAKAFAVLTVVRRRAAALATRLPWPGRAGQREAWRRELRQAEDGWEEAVVEEGLLQRALAEIGDEAASTDPRIGWVDTGRLLASDDDQPFVATAPSRRIEALVTAARSSVVGVGGERGCGKSSVLRDLAHPTAPTAGRTLGVFVAAPAEGPPQEFVAHLFGEVCRAVLDHAGQAGDDLASGATDAAPAWPARIAATFTATAGVATTALAAWSSISSAAASMGGWIADRPTAAWTGLATAVGAAATTQLLRRDRQRHEVADDVVRLAAHHRARLRFLRSDTVEASAGVDLPRGVKVGRKWGRQHTEQARTHPELVADFRRFAERAARSLRSAAEPVARIVVAIDDLDKLDRTAADRFMRELRAIAGTPGCHYVVAVSESAVQSFEHRLLDGTTAVDSTFDAVIRLPALTLAESRQVLRSRVPLPGPCVLLCHVLSGGRARDLLRAARSLAELRNDHEVDDVREVARRLVRHDLCRLAGSPWCDGAAGPELATGERVEAWLSETGRSPTAAAMSEAAYAYHAATVQRAFVDDLDVTLAAGSARDGLVDFARARLDIADQPGAAWDLVDAYRAARGWPTVVRPSASAIARSASS